MQGISGRDYVLTRWQFWLLTILAAATASLVVASMVRFAENRRLQAEVSQRAQFVQQTVPLEALNREIVTALAQLAVRGPDEQIRAMLSSLGISVSENPAVMTPSPAGTASQPKKK